MTLLCLLTTPADVVVKPYNHPVKSQDMEILDTQAIEENNLPHYF